MERSRNRHHKENVQFSYEVTTDDIHRAARARKPSARLPDSKFLRTLGTEDVYTAPPQTGALSLRAAEEWARCICENLAFSILHQAQEGRPELIKKDGGEMLVSIVLDPSFSFFLWCGRSRPKARSLHVKKQFEIKSTLAPVVM